MSHHQAHLLQQIKCPKHHEYIKGVCLFPGPCSERLLCRSCRRNHDNNHLNNYEELDDLFNGKIANDITRELDQLLKKVEHQAVNLEKNKNFINNQFNSLTNNIQQFVHQRMNETKSLLLKEINQKLHTNRETKDTIIMTRDNIENSYSSLNSGQKTLSEIQILAEALFYAQAMKEQYSNNPQYTNMFVFDPNTSFLSPNILENLTRQVQNIVEKVCNEIMTKNFSSSQDEDNQQNFQTGMKNFFNQSSTEQNFFGQGQKSSVSHENNSRRNNQPQGRKPGQLFSMGQQHQGFKPERSSTNRIQQERFPNRFEKQQHYEMEHPYYSEEMIVESQDQYTGTVGTTHFNNMEEDQGMFIEQEQQDQSGMIIEERKKEGTSSKRKHTPQKLLQLFQQADEDEKTSLHQKGSMTRGHRRNFSFQSTSKGDPRRSAKSSEHKSRSKSEEYSRKTTTLREKTTLRTEHQNIAFGGLVYVPSKNQIITSGTEGFMEAWDLQRRSKLQRWEAHSKEIFKIVFIESLNVLLSAGSDGHVHVWEENNSSWRLKAAFQNHKGPVFAMEYLSDLNIVASGGEDEFLRLWRISDGNSIGTGTRQTEEVLTMKTAGKFVGSICYLRKFRLLAVGFDKGHINMIKYEKQNWKPAFTIKEHQTFVLNLVFDEDRDLLVSASEDGVLMVTRIFEGKYQTLATMGQPKIGIKCIGVLFDRELIISNHDDKQVRFWSLSGEKLSNRRDDSFGEAMATLKNKNEIATATGNDVKLWTVS